MRVVLIALASLLCLAGPSQADWQSEFDAGNAAYKNGAFDTAIANFTKAIGLRPDNAEAYDHRGNAYDDKGLRDSAIADYAKAIQLKPDYSNAYFDRGVAYGRMGLDDEAIADFTKVIELKPDSGQTFRARGQVFAHKGLIDQAIADYDTAIRLKPNCAEAYGNRGAAYDGKGLFDQAIADYSKMIELKPNSVEAYYNRGLGYAHKGLVDQAIADYTKAIELKPDFATAMRGLGQLHLQSGASGKGLPLLEQAFAKGDQLAAYGLAAAFSGKYGVPSDSEKYALWLDRLKPSLRAAPAGFVVDALEKHAGPVLLDDGTTVEVLRWLGNKWFVHTVTASGFIDLRSATESSETIDNTRRATNIHLQLYTCVTQQGRPDSARLNLLHAAGRYMEAVIELRKGCEDPGARAWLAAKASEGYAPYEIEYADWLRRSGDAKAAHFYVLGGIRLFEDAAICEDSGALEDASSVGNIYEKLAQELSKMARKARVGLFARAANESEKIGVVGRPDYVCYHGWTFKIRDAKSAEDVGVPDLRPAVNWTTLRAKIRAKILAEVSQ